MADDNDYLNQLLDELKTNFTDESYFSIFIEFYKNSTNEKGKIFLIQNISKYLKIPLQPKFKEIQKKIIKEKNCNVRLKILIDKILEKKYDNQDEISEGLEQLRRYNEINHIVINKIAIYVILEELVNYDFFKEFKDEFDNLLKKCNMTYASLKDYAVDLEYFKDFDEFKRKYDLYYQFYLKGYGTKNKDKLKRLVETLFEIIRENFPFLLYKIHQTLFRYIINFNENDDELKRLNFKNNIITELNKFSILENLIQIIKRIRINEDLFNSFFRLLQIIFDKFDNIDNNKYIETNKINIPSIYEFKKLNFNISTIDLNKEIYVNLDHINSQINEDFRVVNKTYDELF